MLPLPWLLKSVQGTRNKVNKWIADEHLTNSVPEGSPGVASIISRMAGLEIAFMTVLTRMGYAPSDANAIATNWLRRIKAKQDLQPVWILNAIAGTSRPAGGHEPLKTFLTAPEQTDMPTGTEHLNAIGFAVINVAEIISRVDAIERLYAQTEGK